MRRSETVYGTRTQADDRLAELRGGRGRRGGAPTVGEVYLGHYVPFLASLVAKGKMKRSTPGVYTTSWRAHVGPRWGDVPVTEVRAADVQAWLSSMSGSVASIARCVLKGVMDRALMLEVVEYNVVDREFIMPDGSRPHSKEIWTLAELERAHAALRGTVLEAPFLLQAHGGLRVGESLAVEAGAVSVCEAVATVPVLHTVLEDGSIDETKRKCRRTAYVTDPWCARLSELVDEALSRGDRYLSDDGFGGPLRLSVLRAAWKSFRPPDGMGKILMRNLRSSYETYMHWELHMPFEMVSKLMGHRHKETTLVYDRPKEKAIRDAVAGTVDHARDVLGLV